MTLRLMYNYTNDSNTAVVQQRRKSEMTTEIETTIYTEDNVRVHVGEWDEGGVWLSLQTRGSSQYAALTRAEAEQMLKGLQAILEKEVTA